MKIFVDGAFPGCRDMLRATTVMTMPTGEASSTTRSGPSGDDKEDYALPVGVGVIPVRMEVSNPVPDPRNIEGVARPDHILDYRLG